MAIPKKITELVSLFHSKKHELTEGKYKEFQLQTDFLTSFFTELGWDIENKSGLTEKSRDVIQQFALRVGPTTKAPDYSFGIGRERKFIVEAKKPSVDLKNDPVPAMQARSYGWNASLPLAILTDFEEFSVYDCRIRPKKNDKATTGRIFYCTYEEYAQRWDEIAGIFSREAVLHGDFDRFAQTKTKHRGTDAVDEVLLKDIDEWRRSLATNIAIRNESLTEEQVNYAVQKIIDRILFLRICEDRGIEEWGILLRQTNGTGIYGRLIEQFRHADQRYNSGLFHFHEESSISESPDTVTPGLTMDDKILKQIITSLYPPESPYNFAVLPTEILGQVYEQFLGKVIRLTAGHHAKVEEKPEVRKAGGVYYTPAYIVEYIVEKTVGELLEGKIPKQAAKLTIVDPACGSGSFLLGAYQKLLDWHLEYYTAHDPQKWKKELYKGKSGDWKLTTAERKRILLANIYGVDIDAQAVEVTKLSLLLKVLEGEDEETLGKQLGMFKERALPSLSENIKCGNSLIGSDFSDSIQTSLLPSEQSKNVNPFDWEHAFPDVFRVGRFDAVIGNPPYFSAIKLEKSQQEYFRSKYGDLWASRNDIAYYFVLKALMLTRSYSSFIIPRYYLNSYYAKGIRSFLAKQGKITIIDTENDQCFKGVNILTTILTIQKGDVRGVSYRKAKILNQSLTVVEQNEFSSAEVSSENWNFGSDQSLLSKIATGTKRLCDFFDIAKGMSTGLNSAFEIEEEDASKFSNKEYLRSLIKNGDIRRYKVNETGRSVLYLEGTNKLDHLPEYKCHLIRYKNDLEKRKSAKCAWFHYSAARNRALWEHRIRKIVVPFMATENRFAVDDRDVISTSGDVNAFIPKKEILLPPLEYFLGILNSKLMNYYHKKTTKLKRGGYMEYVSKQLEKLPIRVVDFKVSADKARHDRMVTLVDRMLDLHKGLAAAKTPHEQDQFKRQISATDHEIDEMVFDLYELTKEEREIVLQAT